MTYIPKPIKRSDLEYPTEDVSFAYLSAINKLQFSSPLSYGALVITLDNFTDKAIESVVQVHDHGMLILRHQDRNNYYESMLFADNQTSDHKIIKVSGGTATDIAVESVDIDYTGEILCGSISGSTIKSLRYIFGNPARSITAVTPTAIISATDAEFASGYFGLRPIREVDSQGFCDIATARLLPPQTPLPSAKTIIEAEIAEEEHVRPLQLKDLREIPDMSSLPDFLYRKAERYYTLKNKGFTDEEIKALLGYIPQHQVDLALVTWGVFDHKPEHNTMLITITAGNPYTGEKAIQEQIEHAKNKNLKVLKPPRDYNEAVEQYEMLKKDFPEWIAGRHNYCYQVLGHEDFEAMQVADTYYGNIVDGIKPDVYKRVPEWELRRTLAMWKDRLKRATIVKSEAEKHLKKLEEVEKIGW